VIFFIELGGYHPALRLQIAPLRSGYAKSLFPLSFANESVVRAGICPFRSLWRSFYPPTRRQRVINENERWKSGAGECAQMAGQVRDMRVVCDCLGSKSPWDEGALK